MTIRHTMLALLATATVAAGHSRADQLLYLASNQDKTIVALEIDPETGTLTEKHRVVLPANPGPLAFSPDASFVYAAVTGLPDKRAGIVTLKRRPSGSLRVVATSTITTRTPYMRTDKSGRFMLASHYGAGDVTVYRIVDGICTDELLDHKKTEKTAHCIEIDPSGRYVFVPHTAPNKVYQFVLDETTGKLTPNDPPYVDGPDANHKYHEPRHYVHHPKLKMAYTSNENGGGISAWRFDDATGTLKRIQTLCTLPPDFKGRSAAADIHLTPDARFAYVSNRDATERGAGEPKKDTLAGVALDPKTGRMKIIGHYPTAPMPRSFCIDLTGRFVYAAGQTSASLYAYRIDRQSGHLDHFATYQTGGGPIWVMCGSAGG